MARIASTMPPPRIRPHIWIISIERISTYPVMSSKRISPRESWCIKRVSKQVAIIIDIKTPAAMYNIAPRPPKITCRINCYIRCACITYIRNRDRRPIWSIAAQCHHVMMPNVLYQRTTTPTPIRSDIVAIPNIMPGAIQEPYLSYPTLFSMSLRPHTALSRPFVPAP